jgi:hypothetical protein
MMGDRTAARGGDRLSPGYLDMGAGGGLLSFEDGSVEVGFEL